MWVFCFLQITYIRRKNKQKLNELLWESEGISFHCASLFEAWDGFFSPLFHVFSFHCWGRGCRALSALTDGFFKKEIYWGIIHLLYNSLKVCKSVVFRIFTGLCNYHHCLVLEHFFVSPPKTNLIWFHSQLLPTQVTIHIFSVFINLPILDILHKYNYTIYSFLWVLSQHILRFFHVVASVNTSFPFLIRPVN